MIRYYYIYLYKYVTLNLEEDQNSQSIKYIRLQKALPIRRTVCASLLLSILYRRRTDRSFRNIEFLSNLKYRANIWNAVSAKTRTQIDKSHSSDRRLQHCVSKRMSCMLPNKRMTTIWIHKKPFTYSDISCHQSSLCSQNDPLLFKKKSSIKFKFVRYGLTHTF